MSFDAAPAPTGVRTQVCTWCHYRKPVGEFWRNPSGWVTRECRTCAADRLQCWAEVDRHPVPPRRTAPPAHTGLPVQCGRCGRLRPRELFNTFADSSGRRYLRRNCKQCAGALLTAYKAARSSDPAVRARARDQRLAKTYGISSVQFESLLAAQDGRCAVCRTDQPGGPTPTSAFHVDHDHATGRVRGLLCRACNTALGLLADDPSRITALLTYLTHPQEAPDA